jgi:hypothetical protein
LRFTSIFNNSIPPFIYQDLGPGCALAAFAAPLH